VAGERRDVGLPHPHVGPGAGEPLGEVALQRELVARRGARRVGRRVEPDQRAEQADQVVLPSLDLGADRLLGRRQRQETLTRRS
jgi:hypothetical protein